MSTQVASRELRRARTRHSARVLAVLAIGPGVILAGVVCAFVQPWRLTILHPRGEGFWWLAVEPPLLVVLAGVLFGALVAAPLVRDLEDDE